MTTDLTQEEIEKEIVDEFYHTFPLTTATVCVLKLRNGFYVFGTCFGLDDQNFNEMRSAKNARINAITQLQSYLVFRKKDKHAGIKR